MGTDDEVLCGEFEGVRWWNSISIFINCVYKAALSTDIPAERSESRDPFAFQRHLDVVGGRTDC